MKSDFIKFSVHDGENIIFIFNNIKVVEYKLEHAQRNLGKVEVKILGTSYYITFDGYFETIAEEIKKILFRDLSSIIYEISKEELKGKDF